MRTRSAWGAMCAWALLVCASLAWNWHQVDNSVDQLARVEARSSFEKDLVYRRWASGHGGVYVPPTPQTPPNPYLEHLPDRDVMTTGGKKLTLVNPAYMTRQVHELAVGQYGARGHITSLKPLRPENAADEWETRALNAFESGVREVVSTETIDGAPFLRFMRPLVTEESCLKCHQAQGYKVGDIRGGISVSIPFRPYLDVAWQQRSHLLIGHGVIGMLGLFGLWAAYRRLERVEKRLRDSHEVLNSIMETTKDGFWRVSAEARLLDVNPAYCRLSGYARQELLGMSLQELEAEESADQIEGHIQRVIRNGSELFETRHRRKDGSVWRVEVSAVYRGVGEGEFFVFLRDITERKATEEALGASENRFRLISSISSDVLYSCRRSEKGQFLIDWIAGNTDRLFGRDAAEIMARGCWRPFVVPEDLAQFDSNIARLEAGASSDTILRIRHRHGTVRYLRSVARVESESGRQERHQLYGALQDITERMQAEEKLHLAASVFSHASEGIMITAADGTIIEVNDAFTRITGYARDEVLGRNPRMLKSGRHDEAFYRALWTALAEKGHWYGDIWNRRKNGEVYAEMLNITALRDAGGVIRQYVALFSDITLQKEHERELERIAHYDALTTLPNRVLLADRLNQAMLQAPRRGQRLAVAYLDLDGFKRVNDTYGHESGDQLLIALANRMKQTLREGDTIARMGGDEFVAVLLDLPDADMCLPMLDRLLASVAQPISVGEVVHQISASLGVTFYPQAEDVDADQLLRQSDQAMYQAKLAGKNRFHVFDTDRDRSVRGHHESLERIRRALSDHELVLHYQPKVNMRTGAVVGAEALIRWQHPERGLLAPGEFLPVIEDHPLAVDVGDWVIHTALAQMEAWQEAGLNVPVSVNIGARQLQQPDFVDRLRAILATHAHVNPEKLMMEIVETSALEDLTRISRIIEECQAIGVNFSLDDFGTGYSSLTYLKRLPVQKLKIDQSFVRDMLDDPDDLAILEGVIGLAAAFGREVIAEGVETVEHGRVLLRLGCELAQGYGISRPMPAPEFAGWAASWCPDPVWRDVSAIDRNDLPLLYAGSEHRAWLAHIETCLKGERDLLPTLDSAQCRFGRWLQSEGRARYQGHSAVGIMEDAHSRMHALAAEICASHSAGGGVALGRLEELRGLLETFLDSLKRMMR